MRMECDVLSKNGDRRNHLCDNISSHTKKSLLSLRDFDGQSHWFTSENWVKILENTNGTREN